MADFCHLTLHPTEELIPQVQAEQREADFVAQRTMDLTLAGMKFANKEPRKYSACARYWAPRVPALYFSFSTESSWLNLTPEIIHYKDTQNTKKKEEHENTKLRKHENEPRVLFRAFLISCFRVSLS